MHVCVIGLDNSVVRCVFLQESSIEFDAEHKKPFFELHYILESLQRKDLDPALRLLIY